MSAKVRSFPATRRLLRDVSEALFYRGSPLPSQQLDWVEHEAMTTLILAGRRARLLFSACLFAVGWLAPLLVWRFPTVSRLPLSLRITALTKLEDSRLGAPLFLGLKAVLCFIYYEQAEPLRAIGHSPGCAGPAGPESRRSLPLLPAAAATPTAAFSDGTATEEAR